MAWKEAAETMGFELSQCCGIGYEMEGIPVYHDIEEANVGAILNPCPPFYRGEEVSEDVMESKNFVGYEFKKHLLTVQQAVMIYCITHTYI